MVPSNVIQRTFMVTAVSIKFDPYAIIGG
jgi:hypothetical protein